MRGQIIDGKAIAAELNTKLAKDIAASTAHAGRSPGLAVILVGQDPASEIYVRNKRLACEAVGIQSYAFDLPATTSEQELLARIDELNADLNVDGILIQLPLPAHIDAQKIMEHIRVDKDVDGFHPYNLGRLAQRCPLLRPCTPYGVMRLLAHIGVQVAGLQATVVGASKIVGLPMSLELILAGATVTVCRSSTRDLAGAIKQADLLIAATGQPDLIQSEWIKPGAIVIDVGIHRGNDGKIHGDLNFDTAIERAAWITPVPGGVGPMTISTLLANTFYAFQG
jgi:methylenetetrahydrofolate dehydrogenase (NADP+)/methenyltetrahydrofolate cyclohydrolase